LAVANVIVMNRGDDSYCYGAASDAIYDSVFGMALQITMSIFSMHNAWHGRTSGEIGLQAEPMLCDMFNNVTITTETRHV